MISLGASDLLFGALARTSRGREQLTQQTLQTWTSQERADSSDWWINRDAGVALFRPQVRLDHAQGQSVLSIRGLIRPREGKPSAPSQADNHSSKILSEILERDALAIRDLRGQWVLACWDDNRRRLLVARDHLGQRVIFTRTDPDLFIFCSELSPLLRLRGKSVELDEETAFWYLSFGRPTPGRTLARGVGRLPAAHLISWGPGNAPLEQRYWSPLKPDSQPTDSPELHDAIQQALDRSIAEYCSLETPQGVFLSGGTDSTYLVTTASSLSGVELTAFTSAFEDELGINDDVRYASEVAAGLDVPHRVVPLHAGEALEILEEEVLLADEPCAAFASLTHFKLLATAKELGVGWMLSGLGADEIFGGYDNFHYYYARYLEFCSQHQLPPGMDGFDFLLLQDDSVMSPVLYGGITRLFSDHVIRDKFLEPYRSWKYTPYLHAFYRECRRIKPEANPIEMMVSHECQHRIPEMLFANFEPISRRAGIGVHYPWLDPDVVELAAGLDVLARYRTPAGDWSPHIDELVPGFKHTLMRVYEGKVPEKVLRRPIKTFTAPFREWFAKPDFAAPIIARVRASRFWERGIVKREWLDWLDFPTGQLKANFPFFQTWGLITFTAWYDRFIDPPARSK